MIVRWLPLWIWALTAAAPALAFAQTPSPATDEPRLLNLVYHADVMGRLAVPGCGSEDADPPNYAALVSVIETLRGQNESQTRPLALLGGNSLAPGLFARGILARKGAAGAQAVAAMFKQGGYSAVALGHHDLGLERVRLERFAEAAQAQGLPLVATNLSCDGRLQPLCRFLVPEVIVEHDGRKVAVLSVLSPLVQAAIARPLMRGLVINPPLAAVQSALRRLAGRGDIAAVVLMTQMPGTKAARQELEALQLALGQNTSGLQVNVMLAGGLSTNTDQGVLRVLRQDGSPTIVGSSPDTQSVAWVQVRGLRASVETLASAQAPEDPTTAALLAPYIEQYCDWYGDPLAPAAVDGALTRDDFLTYLLSIMRKQARAEVALLNRGFVKPDVFPLRGRIRRAELYRAIPYRAQMGVVRLQGADVEKLLIPALADEQLARLGIAGAPPNVRINGRPLDKARSYRIATIEFVANGGDDLFDPGALAFAPLPNGDLRQAVERFLASQTAAEDNNPDVSVARDFGPPASERMLWVWISDLTLDLNNTSITGTRATMPSQGYNAPQLTRAEQRAARGQINNVLQLRSLRHEGDLRLYGEFGYSRNQPQGKPAVGAETSDLVQLSGLYSYRGLRDTSLPVPKAAVPDPYVRTFLESEFTRPAQRAYRHAELTATVGAQFSVLPKVRMRGGPGLRKQLLADGPQGRLLPLLEAGAIMDPVGMPLISGLVARLEGWVDYVYVDPADLAQHQVKLQSRLSVPLVPILFLTVGADVYATKAAGRGWASAVDTLVGLRTHFDAARQRL